MSLSAAPTLRARSASLLGWLPRGTELPEPVWKVRHRWAVAILAVQAALLPAFALVRGYTPRHAMLEAVAPAALAGLACVSVFSRAVRSSLAAVGLMVVSGLVVHISGGSIEAHFHFFIMIPIVGLYESWKPFGLAVFYVLVQHGAVGTLQPESVYDHAAAQQKPWAWAAVHAVAFAAACMGSLVNWRLHERARQVESDLNSSLSHRALHDELTGLPNRTHLHERGRALLHEQRQARGALSVLIIDLDGFKEINDTLGHSAGDALLRQIGPRLRRCLRETDAIARLGGDEFAVVLPGMDEFGAVGVAQRLRAALSEGFTVSGVALNVEASIGTATVSEASDISASDQMDELVRQADIAMYAAKCDHTGVASYSAEQDGHSRDRLTLLGELRIAMQHDELVLHYQPKVDVMTGDVIGAEALLRWQHPRHGLLSPAAFIPAAEASSLMLPLTLHVVDLALATVAGWSRANLEVPVAVNLSAKCLLDEDLPVRITELLERHAVPAHLLRLELTESALMSDPDRALRILNDLAARGIKLSLDDFGTGYSSMSYLQRLPVDELKIDSSFVSGMDGDAVSSKAEQPMQPVADASGWLRPQGDKAVLVQSAVDLGHNLGLRVVAEGVECEHVLSMLAAATCDIAQGFHIARPMDAAGFVAWLTHRPSTERQRR